MALAGKGGRFQFDEGGTPKVVADLRDWSLNIDRDLFEISTFGSSGWRDFQQNLNGAQGSISGYWNVEGSTTMKAIQSNILDQSAAATAEFWVDSVGLEGYSAEVFITSLSPAAAVDGIVEFSADMTITGAVTYSTALTAGP